MTRIIDRKGQKFNKWTFIEFKGVNSNKDAIWLCKCECGFEKIQVAYNVVGGQSRQCLKCSFTKNYKENELSPSVWKTMKANAARKGRELYVSREYVIQLFLLQNKKCALSGIPIEFAKSNNEYKNGKQTASLDRIDSSKGYTKDNIQWVHKDINKMKNVFSEDKLIFYCEHIYKYSLEKNKH